MKKLLFGLLLTVCVSGFSFGKDSIQKNDNNEIFVFSKLKLDCTIAIHTVITDKCGNRIGIRRETYQASGSACNGFEGGVSIVMQNQSVDTGSCQTLGEVILDLFG